MRLRNSAKQADTEKTGEFPSLFFIVLTLLFVSFMLFQFCLNLAREKQNVALNIVVMIVNKIKIDVVVVEGREGGFRTKAEL